MHLLMPWAKLEKQFQETYIKMRKRFDAAIKFHKSNQREMQNVSIKFQINIGNIGILLPTINLPKQKMKI